MTTPEIEMIRHRGITGEALLDTLVEYAATQRADGTPLTADGR